MSIKIECSQCGYQNDLGRVFCAQCGVKLDLQATSAEEFDDRQGVDIGRFVRRILVSLVLVLIIGLPAIALWPETVPPVLSDKAGAIQVPMKAKAVRAAISFNRSASIDLSESELNGFLNERARSRNLAGLAIDLKPGVFDLYARQEWTPPVTADWAKRIRLKYSMRMRGAFVNGVLRIETVRFGHLPLVGFIQEPVVGFFADVFADITREKRVVSALKSVALEETRADLVFGP